MGFFQFTPELSELLRPEVGQDFAIHVNDRREVLAGEADHFVVGDFVGDDVNRLIYNAAIPQPALRAGAPSAKGLDEKSDSFRFHAQTVVANAEKLKSAADFRSASRRIDLR